MNKVTVDDIMALNPCEDYTREVVENLWNGKESLSLKEILNLDIDIDDRSWVLTELVPTEILPKWSQHCAIKAKEYVTATEATWAARLVADEAANYAARVARAATKSTMLRVVTKYAEGAAHWTAVSSSKNYDKTLKELLEKLIEMTEENND